VINFCGYLRYINAALKLNDRGASPMNSPDKISYSLMIRQNSALTPKGRHLFLTAIAFNSLIIGGFFAFMGAWPVLPYAGLEWLAVVWAFNRIARRDRDFERITIADSHVAFESLVCGRACCFEGNRAWAQLHCSTDKHGGRCKLALRYAGQQVSVGKLLNDDQRLEWAKALQDRMTVIWAKA
jgi:uncharacterized membrane protein